MSSTKVRFLESESGVLSLLEIASTRRRALFPKVAAAMFALRVQIVRAESRVHSGRRIERLCLVELDGAPISARRRLEIQTEILATVEANTLPARRAYLTQSGRPPPA